MRAFNAQTVPTNARAKATETGTKAKDVRRDERIGPMSYGCSRCQQLRTEQRNPTGHRITVQG